MWKEFHDLTRRTLIGLWSIALIFLLVWFLWNSALTSPYVMEYLILMSVSVFLLLFSYAIDGYKHNDHVE